MDNHTRDGSEHTGNNGSRTEQTGQPAARPEIVAKTQEMAGQLVDQARQQVMSQIESQKERAAESLGSIAQALHTVGDQLRMQQQPAIAEYSDSVAGTADRVFNYLADRDLNQLAGDVEQFARRQPALFLTGAFAIGFLASRFFKSSSNGYDYGAGWQRNDTTDLRSLSATNTGAAWAAPTSSSPSVGTTGV